MRTDRNHLNAIELRLSHERDRLASARTEKDRAFRAHNVAMIEKERASELRFLGLDDTAVEMTGDELLAELLK